MHNFMSSQIRTLQYSVLHHRSTTTKQESWSHRCCYQMECLWSMNLLKLRFHLASDPSTPCPFTSSSVSWFAPWVWIQGHGLTPSALRPGLETEKDKIDSVLASVTTDQQSILHLDYYLLMLTLSVRLNREKEIYRNLSCEIVIQSLQFYIYHG